MNNNFSVSVIFWYKKNKRQLPWRNTRDPYLIWLSEIILQQTRVEQGLPYYRKFVENFPTVRNLAAANEKKIMKLWQGLGYYSRARNLHHTAKEIVKKYKGNFPSEYNDLIKLKGIGTYTAAAIASFAFKKNYPVVDGNVYRLFSRYFGIDTPVNSSKAKKEFYALAQSLIENQPPDIFNQAIMEFGAMQCKPGNPDCLKCPLHESCFAFRNNCVSKLPVKSKKNNIRDRHFHYLVVEHDKKLLLKKRTKNDIWKNLYDFPLIETSRKISGAKFLLSKNFKHFLPGSMIKSVKPIKKYKHQLTHQIIYARFYSVKINSGKIFDGDNFISLSQRQLKSYAVPKLIENYLAENF